MRIWFHTFPQALLEDGKFRHLRDVMKGFALSFCPLTEPTHTQNVMWQLVIWLKLASRNNTYVFTPEHLAICYVCSCSQRRTGNHSVPTQTHAAEISMCIYTSISLYTHIYVYQVTTAHIIVYIVNEPFYLHPEPPLFCWQYNILPVTRWLLHCFLFHNGLQVKANLRVKNQMTKHTLTVWVPKYFLKEQS